MRNYDEQKYIGAGEDFTLSVTTIGATIDSDVYFWVKVGNGSYVVYEKDDAKVTATEGEATTTFVLLISYADFITAYGEQDYNGRWLVLVADLAAIPITSDQVSYGTWVRERP